MSKIQPEKYYEACITHHLVSHFEYMLDKKSILLVSVRLKKNRRV